MCTQWCEYTELVKPLHTVCYFWFRNGVKSTVNNCRPHSYMCLLISVINTLWFPSNCVKYNFLFGYWFLPMCIFQMYVFISFKITKILPVYLLRYLFWFFIFLRQVFIFRAVLLLTLCQCAASRCYISWVCIIIKPSLYILNQCLLLCVHAINSLCLFLNTVCKLYSITPVRCTRN